MRLIKKLMGIQLYTEKKIEIKKDFAIILIRDGIFVDGCMVKQ